MRDPRDVVASSLETPWTDAGAAGLARTWRRFTLGNMARGQKAGDERFLQVRYEDLARDPEATLRKICSFLREDFDSGMLTDLDRRRPTMTSTAKPHQWRAMQPIAPPAERSWARRLTRPQQAVVSSVVGDLLPRLGYEPADPALVRAGRVLTVAAAPARLIELARYLRLLWISRDPAARHREVQGWLRDQAGLVAAARR